MADPTLIGLGFQGDAANRFQSADPNLAPGSNAFYACALVNLQESMLVAPTDVSYFGNFNAELPPNSRGWEIGRAADTPASDPPNTPEIVTLRVRFGHGVTATTLTYSADAQSMFGRTHLIAISVEGLVATLYVNGAAVAQETFVGAFNLGVSGLTYGNIAGGGFRSGDPVISAAYSDTDAANFILQQRALFEGVRTSGRLAATISALGLSAAYIYESFQHKAPISGVPTTPLKNFGSAGVDGNLIFAGSAALVINADTDPDYTGGAQSTSVGPGSVNLQDAYNAGPTGLIATGVPGPFGVDDIRVEANGIFTEDSAAVPPLLITGGADTAGGTGGQVNIAGGASAVAGGIGGPVLVVGGDGETDGGSVTVAGGPGTNGAGGNASLIAGNGLGAGAIGGTATVQGGGGEGVGEVIIQGGDSTTLSDGGRVHIVGGNSTVNNGGNVEIDAGLGGPTVLGGSIGIRAAQGGADAGGAAGNGGQLILAAGTGGTGNGGGATAGNGGELNIAAGASGTVLGGAAPGVGGALILSAGNGVTGDGGTVTMTGGNGDTLGGGVTISAGASAGPILPVSINGGPALGIGSGPGGNVEIIGGPAAVGEPQNGGNVEITGGLAGTTGIGGPVNITGGSSDVGPGGEVNISGGPGGGGGVDNGGVGGNVNILAGAASQPANQGGGVIIAAGSATGAGVAPGGFVSVDGGDSTNDVGGSIFLRTGAGATTAQNGAFELGLGGGGGGPGVTAGGFHLDPGNNRITLRNEDYAGTETGTLLLHRLDTAGEALQVLADGLLHYRDEQAVGVETTVGFRAARSGAYGLVGRVYNRTFVTADAPGDTLTVTHNLDCITPGVAVYDPTGIKVFENPAGLAGVVVMSADVVELTFAAGFIGAGTWTVSIFGF